MYGFSVWQQDYPEVATLHFLDSGFSVLAQRRMRPSACVCALSGYRMTWAIHSFLMASRSGRTLVARKYFVVFIAIDSYWPNATHRARAFRTSRACVCWAIRESIQTAQRDQV